LVVRIGSPKLRFKIFNDDATTRAVRSIFHLEDIEYFVPRSVADQVIRLDLSLPVRFEVRYDFWPRLLAVCVLGPSIIIPLAWFVLSRRRAKSAYSQKCLKEQTERILIGNERMFGDRLERNVNIAGQ
jgi:hypothetical protein